MFLLIRNIKFSCFQSELKKINNKKNFNHTERAAEIGIIDYDERVAAADDAV